MRERQVDRTTISTKLKLLPPHQNQLLLDYLRRIREIRENVYKTYCSPGIKNSLLKNTLEII